MSDKRLPLAINTIASHMQFKQTIHDWQSVLDNTVWEYVGEELSLALLPSYHDFPSHLKQCFMYCAVFPKDTVMKKERLVKLWMAQAFFGFDEGKNLEMIGEEYFNELAMRSFFQDFKKDSRGSIVSCKMHDLMHAFAQSLTRAECSINQMDSRETCSRKVRHLVVPDIENPYIPKAKKHLRTLITRSSDPALVAKCFRGSTYLWTLDLSGSELKELPKEVGMLLHLRYLDLSETQLTELPETVCKLSNLQILKLNTCFRLCKLPNKIGELSNLRHFEIDVNVETPNGVGRLSHLQTLSKFIVSGATGGCRIQELGNLTYLRGGLEIHGLWQVDDRNEAKLAGLHKKKNLDTLMLNFRSPQEFTTAEDIQRMQGVLEGLQPHNYLKDLDIRDYPGLTLNPEIMSGLNSLSLVNCPNMKHLSAELLKISSCSGGVNGGSTSSSPTSLELFPRLKYLNLVGLPEWEYEKIEEETINNTTRIASIMPCLFSLEIECCRNLKVVPHYMFSQNLKKLVINTCPNLSGMQPCLPPFLRSLY